MSNFLNSSTEICCDLFFYSTFQGVPCEQDACVGYSAVVTALFSLVSFFILSILIWGWKTNRKTSLKQVVLYLLFVAVILRIIRYGILSSSPQEISSSFFYTLGALYLIPLLIAFIAWTLLIFVWIRVYKMMTQEGQLLRFSVFQWNWVGGYVIFVSLCACVWIALIAVNLVSTDIGGLFFNLWSAISLLVLSVGLLVFGRRVNKKLMEQAADRVSNSHAEEFERMRFFIFLNSIIFIVMVVVFVVAGILELVVENSLAWWLSSKVATRFCFSRQAIYRAFELLSLVAISSTFSPPWRTLLHSVFYTSSGSKGEETAGSGATFTRTGSTSRVESGNSKETS